MARRPCTLLLALLAACGQPTAQLRTDGCIVSRAPPGTRVLVFSRTEGYRHQSIAAGVSAIRTLGDRYDFAVEHTEDPAAFELPALGRFAAVVFLNTTGDVLDPTQQAAFETYIRGGRGFAGVHSAADTEYDWAWYGQLIGAYFDSHPQIQQAQVDVDDRDHLSTRCLPQRWSRTDEWYNFRALPPTTSSVLAAVDESSYTGGTMGARHPIAWYHRFDGGRAWYTAMGHTTESYAEKEFLEHLAGGILWTAGVER